MSQDDNLQWAVAVALRLYVNTSNVSGGIMHTLYRSWFFTPNTIHVSANRIKPIGDVNP